MDFLTTFVDQNDATLIWGFAVVVVFRGIRDIVILLLIPKKDRKYVLRLERPISIKG